ncbi:hypothetical protein HPB51_017676 [Rhipicephalus microplus]|uniref:Uncharacterized protein n=1 Tax=Rhipicephalus microplus TaxID=6941 RepID=A0A9J6E2K9_RHIMP|nr:hypothetical protein HPB51_017676 [Rhipicephalus microplus]
MVCDPEPISMADSAARNAVILLQHYFEHDRGTEFLPSLSAMHSYYVSWYGSLARLYLELGLGRKAAFYTRVAALKCMAGKPDPFQVNIFL